MIHEETHFWFLQRDVNAMWLKPRIVVITRRRLNFLAWGDHRWPFLHLRFGRRVR